MRIDTHRFGTLELNADDLFLFPQGIIGMETLHQWALLADPQNESVAWLQSAVRGDRAIALISPRAFFQDYRVHLSRRELTGLHLSSGSEIYVMTTVAGTSGQLTTNLRAPILLNLDRRLGVQVITEDDRPLRAVLPTSAASQLKDATTKAA
ncbi:MAG: flagellar assembly protein FliW [Planctomycetota bacterium]